VARNKKRGDIDADYTAIRLRMTALTAAAPAASNVVPPHGHAAANITFDETQSGGSGRMAADDVQEAIEELDSEKLARSGEQPMLGNLDMDHHDVNNVLNLEVEVNETVGNDLTVVNEVTVTDGSVTVQQGNVNIDAASLNFQGGVGNANINNPRTIHMAGDNDDSEAVIDGLERVLFNDEPTKSSIEMVSRIEFNPLVEAGTDYTPAEGKVSWDAGHDVDLNPLHHNEKTLVAHVASDTGVVPVALGWGVKMALNTTGGSVPRFSLVQVVAAGGAGALQIRPWTETGLEQPELTGSNGIVGVTMTDSQDGETVAVMSRGIMRDVYAQNAEAWGIGDQLWALQADGTITNVRPPAPEKQVFVGTIFDGTLDDGYVEPWHVDVAVRILPEITELSGVSRITPVDKQIIVYRDDDGVWEGRQIRNSRDTSVDDTLSKYDAHLIRADATSGERLIVLPPVADAIDSIFHVKKVDNSANKVTIYGDNAGELIDGEVHQDLVLQGESLMLQCDGASWAVI